MSIQRKIRQHIYIGPWHLLLTELEVDASVTEEFITLTNTGQIEMRDQKIRKIRK